MAVCTRPRETFRKCRTIRSLKAETSTRSSVAVRRRSSANFFSAAQALAALALDFKKNPPDTPVPQQNALQRRDAYPAIAVGILLFKPGELRTEVKTPQLFERITDNQALAVASCAGAYRRDASPERCRPSAGHHFEHVDAQRHGSVESDHRVFGKQVLASAVGDDQREPAPSGRRKGFPAIPGPGPHSSAVKTSRMRFIPICG